jgi:hypothetical protein
MAAAGLRRERSRQSRWCKRHRRQAPRWISSGVDRSVDRPTAVARRAGDHKKAWRVPNSPRSNAASWRTVRLRRKHGHARPRVPHRSSLVPGSLRASAASLSVDPRRRPFAAPRISGSAPRTTLRRSSKDQVLLVASLCVFFVILFDGPQTTRRWSRDHSVMVLGSLRGGPRTTRECSSDHSECSSDHPVAFRGPLDAAPRNSSQSLEEQQGPVRGSRGSVPRSSR